MVLGLEMEVRRESSGPNDDHTDVLAGVLPTADAAAATPPPSGSWSTVLVCSLVPRLLSL